MPLTIWIDADALPSVLKDQSLYGNFTKLEYSQPRYSHIQK